ncbi:MAG: hypothetical protein AAF937_03430, partial [Planctomycetota bacterium]
GVEIARGEPSVAKPQPSAAPASGPVPGRTMEELLLSGRLELDEIITHEFPLSEYEAGFDTMMSGEGIKVVLGIG